MYHIRSKKKGELLVMECAFGTFRAPADGVVRVIMQAPSKPVGASAFTIEESEIAVCEWFIHEILSNDTRSAAHQQSAVELQTLRLLPLAIMYCDVLGIVR